MQPGLGVIVAVLDSGEVVEAVEAVDRNIGVGYILVSLEKFWPIVVDGRVGMIGDKDGVGIMDVIVLGEKLSLVFFIFGKDVLPGDFVEKLPHLLSQQNTLIS